MASRILWSLLNGLLGREEQTARSRTIPYAAAETLQRSSEAALLGCVYEFISIFSFIWHCQSYYSPTPSPQMCKHYPRLEATLTLHPSAVSRFQDQLIPYTPSLSPMPLGCTVPSQGRGSRIMFFINQFTPSLRASPPKKEICKGKTAMSAHNAGSIPQLPLALSPQGQYFSATPYPILF